MNKTAIKNFAIWARNKLIADISYRAGLMGITADGIHPALPQSTGQTKFYDIETAEPYAISGEAIHQREHLADLIRRKAKDSNYQTAYKYIIEEVAYTWFNRLIAVRFMEVNDYLPSHIRVLSSDQGKIEPDLVTTPFDADLDFTRDEQQAIINLKNDNKLDELFRLLFIKQCNALNEILPDLFEKTNDYTELLLNLSVIDQDGVVYHLVHDIPEEDFDIERGGQVEIIGWLYQYYNTEPKNAAFAKKGKITKEEIPAVTQLFTPDWIVRYMVENSLGRLWIEHLLVCGDPRTEAEIAADFGWKYYLPEAEQEPEVAAQLVKIREERRNLTPEEIRCIDPCMGSGHICIYLFSVLMQIYESAGYGQRDAARSILENNLYGLDIDDRAFQMAYFAVMMKAREYNRRILNGENKPNLYSIQESNGFDRRQLQLLGRGMEKNERKEALQEMNELLDTFIDAKEYGSILAVKAYDWRRLERFVEAVEEQGQISLESMGLEQTKMTLKQVIEQGKCLVGKYHVVTTNPPYMGAGGMSGKLLYYVKNNYPESKSDMSTVFMEKTINMCSNDGFMAMINIPVWMFITSYEKLRERLILHNTIVNMIHPGRGIFGADFGTTTFTIRKKNISGYLGQYRRLFNTQVEVQSIESREKSFFAGKGAYTAVQENFLKIPGYPIAYWSSKNFIEDFTRGHLLGKCIPVKKGMDTGDNDKYLRLWYEVEIDRIDLFGGKKKWVPYDKGGDYRKWFGNNSYVLNWYNDGFELKHSKANLRSQHLYFRESITWNALSAGNTSFRYSMYKGTFDSAGSSMFPQIKDIPFYLGLMCSKISQHFLNVINPTINYGAGSVSMIPVIKPLNEDEIIRLSSECIITAKKDWDSFETSWDFKRHPLICSDTEECKEQTDANMREDRFTPSSIAFAYSKWINECKKRFDIIRSDEEELNRIFIDIYGLQDELSADIDEKSISIRLADFQRDTKSLLSYAIGCMFGRYSLDVEGLAYGGGNWNSSKYIAFIPDAANIVPITDEEYLEDDVVGRLCEWLKVVYGVETLEENLDFIAKALGNKGNSSREIIRNYFLTDFFKDHCQTYSVTGSGKRPIYWLFDSGKHNGFKALIYLHRYNVDTIGNLRIDYLHRMQRIYESEIGRMQDMIDHSTNAREAGQATKRKDKLTKQLKECREYDEKLAHLALSRIELDLDDGVKVNYRKMQTANDGKFYEVLADSKNIMTKK